MNPISKITSTKLSSLAIGLTLVAAACGGGSASPESATDADAAPVTGAPTTASQDDGEGDGQNSGDSEFGLSDAEIGQRVDAVEQSIAVCMSDAGFEYFPVDYATARKAMDTDSKPSGLTADEFRDQFGYGITTLSVAANAQATIGLGPNLSIRDGLLPADQVAWNRQLFGEFTDQTFVVGLDNEDLSRTGGCTRTAVEANFSQAELGPGFVNYQNADGARIDQDPRVIDAYKAWSTCMRDAGYSYDTSSAIDVDLANRLDVITSGGDLTELDAPGTKALTELQGEELAIAAADQQCELEFVADIKTAVETEILGAPQN